MTNYLAIVKFRPEYAEAFRTLNEEWISEYFVMEDSDRKLLYHPQENIIDKGGEIIMALNQGRTPVGTVALLAESPHYDYELAKMCVTPAFRNRGIGRRLATTALDYARKMGASSIFLESHSSLTSAIRLYKSLGFKEITGVCSPYKRCDIQMSLDL